jgi:putative phosphoribosyl transferase
MAMTFIDRVDAGRQLAARLRSDDHGPDVVVVGLPRGGVTVAAEVATGLGAPLDVIVVRKLGVPSQPELAMGAIGEDGVRLLNDDVAVQTGVGSDAVTKVEARERAVLDRRVRQYREVRPMVPVAGRTAIVVDDGFATGATARAACRVARQRGAARVVLAVPVAPPGWDERVGDDADECIAVATPTPFWAVGHWYRDFDQVSDDAVIELLRQAAGAAADTTDDP